MSKIHQLSSCTLGRVEIHPGLSGTVHCPHHIAKLESHRIRSRALGFISVRLAEAPDTLTFASASLCCPTSTASTP